MSRSLDVRSLQASIAALAKARVEAVAVCYLHSYRNSRHEKLTGRALARRLPGTRRRRALGVGRWVSETGWLKGSLFIRPAPSTLR